MPKTVRQWLNLMNITEIQSHIVGIMKFHIVHWLSTNITGTNRDGNVNDENSGSRAHVLHRTSNLIVSCCYYNLEKNSERTRGACGNLYFC